MAVDRKYAQSNNILPSMLAVAADARANNYAKSGDPVVIGQLPGVAMNDADANGRTPVQKDGIFNLLVAGIDSSGTSGADANVAVNGGDIIYFDHTKAPPLSKRAGGIFFGYALGDAAVQVVASGVTTTKILVQVGR